MRAATLIAAVPLPADIWTLCLIWAVCFAYAHRAAVFERRISRRGYRGPVIVFGVAMLSLATSLGLTALMMLTYFRLYPLVGHWAALVLRVGAFCPLLGARVAIGALPQRHNASGRRPRVVLPYRLLAVVMLLVTIAIVVMAFLLLVNGRPGVSALMKLAGVTGLVAQLFLHVAEANETPSASDLLSRDPRPPVLYIREFDQDTVMSRPHAYYARSSAGFAPLEELIARQVNASIGPFVALGSPEDFVPPLHGAARIYVEHTVWKRRFMELATQARCIILGPSTSKSVRWELEAILARGLAPKLYLLTAPRREGWLARVLPRTPWKTRIEVQMYSSLDQLRSAGFDVPSLIYPGTVMTFLDNGQGRLLGLDKRDASQLVQTVREDLVTTAAR